MLFCNFLVFFMCTKVLKVIFTLYLNIRAAYHYDKKKQLFLNRRLPLCIFRYQSSHSLDVKNCVYRDRFDGFNVQDTFSFGTGGTDSWITFPLPFLPLLDSTTLLLHLFSSQDKLLHGRVSVKWFTVGVRASNRPYAPPISFVSNGYKVIC